MGAGSRALGKSGVCSEQEFRRLFAWQRSRADGDTLIRYDREMAAAYPTAEVIYVAQDNWPVHCHERLRRARAGSRVRWLRLPT